jgi:hypothetical protein
MQSHGNMITTLYEGLNSVHSPISWYFPFDIVFTFDRWWNDGAMQSYEALDRVQTLI